MKGIFSTLLFLVCSCLSGQEKLRIFRTASELNESIKDTLFAKEVNSSSEFAQIYVTLLSGEVQPFAYDNMWGYAKSDGKIYRHRRGKFFLLEGKTDGLVIFSRAQGKPGQSYGYSYKSKSEIMFFSQSLTSEIKRFKRRNVYSCYEKTKPCFIKKIEDIKLFYLRYTDVATILTPAKIIELYSECK